MKNKGFLLGLLLSLMIPLASAGSLCQDNNVRLQVLGSGGPELDDGRASTSYLLWVNDKARVLVDLGPGASVNFGQTGAQFADLKAIVFTHLHVDHSADFPAFIKGSFFTQRQQGLVVLGPAGNQLMPATTTFVNRLLAEQGSFAYLSNYVDGNTDNYQLDVKDIPLQPHQISRYPVSSDIVLSTIPVHHGPVAAVA